MGPQSAYTHRQMAQYISPKNGNRKKENKREYPSSHQTLTERQTRQPPSHGTDFKPWMESRHHPHSHPPASQTPYRPKRPLNLAFTSFFDDEPPSPPPHRPQPFTNPSSRRDNDPHSHSSHLSTEYLLAARVRIMNKMNPQPEDDHLLHDLAKSHHHHQHHHHDEPEDNKKTACDEKLRGRIETWLDGVVEFLPPMKRTPSKDRSWLRNKRFEPKPPLPSPLASFSRILKEKEKDVPCYKNCR